MKFLDLDGLKYYHQALSNKFNLTPYSKKTETVKDIEVYDPNFANDDDDTPSNTSIRIELADGTHKYVNVPEASGPHKVGTSTYPGNAGFMSISDKAKLDDISNTYLPLSGGIMKGTLYISNISSSSQEGLSIVNVAGIAHTEQGKFFIPEVWTTNASSIPLNKANGIPTLNADGKIDESKIDNLSGYVSTHGGHISTILYEDTHKCEMIIGGDDNIENSSGRITIERTIDGSSETVIDIDGENSNISADSANFTSNVTSEAFKSFENPNKNEVWSTNGGRIDVLNLLKNAAIYVEGEITRAAGSINYNDVINYPNSIVFDTVTGMFYAKKDDKLYTHWNAYLQKNIYPPEKYGAVVDNYVYPLPKQMYRFGGDNNIYICSYLNNVATMTIFTIN